MNPAESHPPVLRHPTTSPNHTPALDLACTISSNFYKPCTPHPTQSSPPSNLLYSSQPQTFFIMPRHHAILVHNQLSSVLKAGLLKSPPPAYTALLNYPPAPTPLRQTLKRSTFDLPKPLRSSPSSTPFKKPFKKIMSTCKPIPIAYVEHDRLRRAFFRDHPFEAYRPKSLVETSDELSRKTTLDPVRRIRPDGTLSGSDDLVGIEQWTELRQRTLLPSAEECVINLLFFPPDVFNSPYHRFFDRGLVIESWTRDDVVCFFGSCVDFAYTLYQYHPAGYNLNSAYQIAVSEFRTLRFEAQTSNSFARQEAEYFGARWDQDLLNQQLKNQDRWIKDREGMEKVKSVQDAFGSRSAPVISTVTSSLGVDQVIHPPVRQEPTFQAGESYLKEVLRKSHRLQSLWGSYLGFCGWQKKKARRA